MNTHPRASVRAPPYMCPHHAARPTGRGSVAAAQRAAILVAALGWRGWLVLAAPVLVAAVVSVDRAYTLRVVRCETTSSNVFPLLYRKEGVLQWKAWN